ncbi:hypothetical protein EQV77_02215 [Halobacillus fulvus]|nr:hypothetical protein EQV77_02215 [Halobacillus fulvus]
MKKVLKWAGVIVLGLIVLGFIFGDEEDTTPPINEGADANQTETEQSEDVADESSDIEGTEIETEEEPVEEEPSEPEMTLAQQNAIGAAEDYISFSGFSRTGLIEQLEFEGFSTEDATFAVDNIQVDWNEQAVISAEQYLDTMSFSRSGLIEQLEFEGYTPEQATYAVDQIGL